MKKYSAIIIDDERNIREALTLLLEQYCPQIELAGTAASAEEGRGLLKKHKVDFIFLDISMPKEDGFSFLGTIPKEDYGIIFVTAYQEYALRALKASAIDYLLKPVHPPELCDAVAKAIQYHEYRLQIREAKSVYRESLDNLKNDIISGDRRLTRITVTEQSGFRIVNLAEIMYLEADGNYTILHLSGLNKIVATRTLGDFDKLLVTPDFFRIHKSIIINIQYLKAYSSHQGNYVELSDGTTLSISRRRLLEFREAIKHYSITLD